MWAFNCSSCNEGECAWNEKCCQRCLSEIQADLFPRSLPSENLRGLNVYSAGSYVRAYSRLIKRIKAQPFNRLPAEQRDLLNSILSYWSEELRVLRIDAIVCAPGTPFRVFLQSDLGAYIGVELSKQLGKNFVANVLEKPAQRLSQKVRRRVDRWKNLDEYPICANAERAIWIKKNLGRQILLIDDVCTSGATLVACHRALAAVGLNVVASFVLARRPMGVGVGLGHEY